MDKHTKAPAGEREAVEVVARLMHWKGRHPNPWKVVARMYSECAANAYPNEWEEGAPLMTVAQHERTVAGMQQDLDYFPATVRALTETIAELRPVLAMVLQALDRDAAEGKAARGEMAEELRAALAAAPAQPAPREVYGCPRCGTGMEVDESAKPAAQEQASRCSDCGYLTSQREHLGCLRKAVAELDAATGSQPQASADDSRKLSDLGNELHNLSCHGTTRRWPSCRNMEGASSTARPSQWGEA